MRNDHETVIVIELTSGRNVVYSGLSDLRSQSFNYLNTTFVNKTIEDGDGECSNLLSWRC
jgi:hypothetical protein